LPVFKLPSSAGLSEIFSSSNIFCSLIPTLAPILDRRWYVWFRVSLTTLTS
jgi:hypothetical protein